MINKLIVIGRVGQEPKINSVNGKEVANFSVAVSRKYNGKENTTWIDVALWDKPNVYPYIKKGGMVYVEGEASARAYTTASGELKSSLVLTAHQIQLLGGGESQKSFSVEGPVSAPVTNSFVANSQEQDNPDDLPF